MKFEKIDKKLKVIKYFLIKTLLPTLIMVWSLFLFFQLITALINKDFQIYFNYAQVALTLFGFTLVGTFFEGKNLKNKTISDKEKKMMRQLVSINLDFLLTAICFLVIYSTSDIMYIKFDSVFTSNIIAIIFGILIFIGIVVLTLGTNSLFLFLKDWYDSMLK